jgi:hypothetical protein
VPYTIVNDPDDEWADHALCFALVIVSCHQPLVTALSSACCTIWHCETVAKLHHFDTRDQTFQHYSPSLQGVAEPKVKILSLLFILFMCSDGGPYILVSRLHGAA